MQKLTSKVDQYHFNFGISNNKTYAIQNNIKGINLIKYWTKIYYTYAKTYLKLFITLQKGECYYGPFKGEFGHFLAHTLPFLMYLHRKGIKIHYCGMELHLPFLIDDKGNSILYRFYPLRDFFIEVAPTSNSTVPPKDVQEKIKEFEKKVELSGLPFWNIGDDFYYWFIHRPFLQKGFTYTYNLNQFYGSVKENACCLFPRKKGVINNKNNGEPWDYSLVINHLCNFFDKVYLCGHPSQVEKLTIESPKVINVTSTNNSEMLKAISRSKLIVTQHSGVVYTGNLVGTDVVIIYNGGSQPTDIGSLNNTLTFRKQYKNQTNLFFAFNFNELDAICKKTKN